MTLIIVGFFLSLGLQAAIIAAVRWRLTQIRSKNEINQKEGGHYAARD